MGWMRSALWHHVVFMSHTSSCWSKWPFSCSITLFLLGGLLTFLSPSLSVISKIFPLLYSFIFAFAFLQFLVDSLTLLYRRSAKKASGKTRCRLCSAYAVTSVVTLSSSCSHLHMATVIVALALLCCALEQHSFHFTTRATGLHYWPLNSLSPVNLMGISNNIGHSGDYSSQDTHKWSTLQALKMEDC